MRRLRYGVAMSLDGFIAGTNGEYDWIVHDPAIDFAAMFAQYDTLLMGRGLSKLPMRREILGQLWPAVGLSSQPRSSRKTTPTSPF